MSFVSSRQRALHLGALLFLTVAACAPAAHTATARRSTQRPGEIRHAEIEAELSRLVTAYDIVRTLRPNMLLLRTSHGRAPQGTQFLPGTFGIKVYLDGIAYGGVESLATIPASTVLEVRWLSALDATTRYGTGHAAGVVSVTTRNARP